MADDAPSTPRLASAAEQTRFAVLIFTDVCGSTALKGTHGTHEYKRAAELHNALFERLAAEEGLVILDNAGDGYFARTDGVAAAVRFALRFQHGLRTMAWPSFPLTARVGIHAGEVADITALGREKVLAPAVDLAARVMSLALGGQVLLTRAPFDEARHFVRAHPDAVEGLSLTWLAHGPYLFKGVEEAVEVFEVGLSTQAPLTTPPDSEKAARVRRVDDDVIPPWRPASGVEIPGRPGWRLAEKLGAGGFGEVWAGEREKTRERRAFKFCFDAERLRALKREVTLTRLLRETLGERDDIVRIFELRLDEPPYFLESELAAEGNLLQWAERQGGLGKIPLADRIELVAATAAALAAAHSVGVLHKDIKPTNVLIFTGQDGRARPRLVDFGIGTVVDAAVLAQRGIPGDGFTRRTIQHSTGTPTYSAPEYLAGKPFTMQGDVYSLGVMLWQLVTGKADAPVAEGWQRDVPDPLLREDITLCVDGDPARRFPSAADLAIRLRALPARRAEAAAHSARLAAEAERAEVDAAVEAARRERQRRLFLAAAIATLIAIIAIPLAIWAVVKQREAEREKANAVAQAAIARKAEKDAFEQAAVADREKTNAQKQALLAEAAEKKANTERDKAKELSREASLTDTAVARQRLTEGQWQEAVSYLGRAVRYDPENLNAQDALWLALCYGKRDAGRFQNITLPHESSILSAAFSPDGMRVVTVSFDATASIWDAKTGLPIGSPLKHKDVVNSAAFSPDGMRVITASDDGTVRIWDVKTSLPTGPVLKHGGSVYTASFSPDGKHAITASRDGTVRIWDAKTGLPFGSPLKNDDAVRSAAFSPDGTRAATASSYETARLRDAKTGLPVGSPLQHENAARIAAFSPDGTRIITVSSDETARIWDAKTGRPLGVPLKHEAAVTSAAFSSDGTRIVTASEDKTARLWDAQTGRPVGPPLRHERAVTSAAFSPDGTRVVTATEEEVAEIQTAHVWDVTTGEDLGSPFKHEAAVGSAAFSPDGTRVATASDDGTARIWDAQTGRPVGVPLKHEGAVLSVAFSPDGTRIITASGDMTAQIWDGQTGRPIGSPLQSKSRILRAAFSPDGTRIITANADDTARLWDAKSGQPTGSPFRHEDNVRSAAFSTDGMRVITTGHDGTARIWDAGTGQPSGAPLEHNDALLGHQSPLNSAAFSRDGTRIVTASYDKTARLWDAKTGRPVGSPLQHESVVNSAAFSTDGTRVITASDDGTARIWDVKTSLPIGPPFQHGGSVYTAAFSTDGTRAITASRDGTARIWEAKTSSLLLAEHAETLTAFSTGAQRDPRRGNLQFLANAERTALLEKLTPFLATSEDWRFAVGLTLPRDPQTALVSSRMTMTVREAATRLIGTTEIPLIREAAACDPGHPVLPFAHAFIEAGKEDDRPANPTRAAWLCEYGLKHLPADTTAADLRLAARFVVEVAKTIPAQKANALLLLDRAAKLAPEDDDTKALRERSK